MEKPADAKPTTPPPAQPETPMLENFFREAKAHYDAAVRAELGFAERLVWFWSNHFCVNADGTVMAGAYEREAIRPHVLGNFADLLLAAEGHPAMLLYLDNASSMGPNSVAGINRNRGLNENLGREILELHTLGVRTGYSQDDVISFAKVITGWTIYLPDLPDRGGEFLYYPRMHEPGPQTVLGKAYRDTGIEQGRAVLADLARHPATALHVATKLARHFVADDPPPALVETLRRTFVETDGDLWQVSQGAGDGAGILGAGAGQDQAPERMDRVLPARPRLQRRRCPPHGRGIDNGSANRCGGRRHRRDSPTATTPGSTASAIGSKSPTTTPRRNAERLDADEMLEIALGPLASAETRAAVKRAETKQQAITLLLMAPEFQRR